MQDKYIIYFIINVVETRKTFQIRKIIRIIFANKSLNMTFSLLYNWYIFCFAIYVLNYLNLPLKLRLRAS